MSNPPKPDLSLYPELPQGCLINYNNKFNLFQIYRAHTVIDEHGKKKTVRETIGSIKDGVLKLGRTYLLKQQHAELQNKIDKLQSDAGKSEEHTHTQTKDVINKLNENVQKSELDERVQGKVSHRMDVLVLGALLSALCGDSDCHAIADLLNHRGGDLLKKAVPELMSDKEVSHDTVRKTLMLLEPLKFSDFYEKLTAPLVKELEERIIAADGQAVRATGITTADNEDLHGAYMLMNFFDTNNRVCMCHSLIERKDNEIFAARDMLNNLDIKGATITADAMSCQREFAQKVLERGAHFMLSLKGNQERSFDEVRYLFNSVNPEQFKTYEAPVEIAHGRIESRRISVLRGSYLSKPIKEKWPWLQYGSIVKVESERTKKSTGKSSWEERYYITSHVPTKENTKRFAEIIRAHWGIENRLHWLLDMRFNQDQMQSSSPNYISNRSAINKLALAMLENYRFWLWDTKRENELLSIKKLQQRCADVKIGVECIACALGLLAE